MINHFLFLYKKEIKLFSLCTLDAFTNQMNKTYVNCILCKSNSVSNLNLTHFINKLNLKRFNIILYSLYLQEKLNVFPIYVIYIFF